MLHAPLHFLSPLCHSVSGAQIPAPLSLMLYFQMNLLCLFLFYTSHLRETPLNIWKQTSLLFFIASSEIHFTKMPSLLPPNKQSHYCLRADFDKKVYTPTWF